MTIAAPIHQDGREREGTLSGCGGESQFQGQGVFGLLSLAITIGGPETCKDPQMKGHCTLVLQMGRQPRGSGTCPWPH